MISIKLLPLWLIFLVAPHTISWPSLLLFEPGPESQLQQHQSLVLHRSPDHTDGTNQDRLFTVSQYGSLRIIKRLALQQYLFQRYLTFYNTHSPLVHLPQYTLFGPQILHKHCLQFLFGISVILGERTCQFFFGRGWGGEGQRVLWEMCERRIACLLQCRRSRENVYLLGKAP